MYAIRNSMNKCDCLKELGNFVYKEVEVYKIIACDCFFFFNANVNAAKLHMVGIQEVQNSGFYLE